LKAFVDLVTIGRVVKPQGRKGEVLTHPLSDRPQRFPTLRRAYVAGPGGKAREITISDCWPHKGKFVLKIDGIDSIDQAEELRGLDIRIADEDLEVLPEGSYYHHQILGLRVESPSKRVLGRAEEIMETGGGVPVLVVRGESGEMLVPLAKEFVLEVDLEGGRIVAVEPEMADAQA
jgi:16S rRNA processing protein RimM